MKGDDGLGDLRQPNSQVITAPSECSQSTVLRHTSHDDHVIHSFALDQHVRDTNVHVRCEAAVESHLPRAVLLTSLSPREVEKSEVHGLPQLVHALTDEEQDRHVCFYDFSGHGPCVDAPVAGSPPGCDLTHAVALGCSPRVISSIDLLVLVGSAKEQDERSPLSMLAPHPWKC